MRRAKLKRLANRLLLGLLLCSGSAAADADADGQADYLLHCGGCHLENGAGDPPNVPSLRVNLDQFAAFNEGRAYLTQVPGAAQVPISDARLAVVLNWILTTYYPDQTFTPYSASEVARHRSTTLLDPLQARQRLLESMATRIEEQ